MRAVAAQTVLRRLVLLVDDNTAVRTLVRKLFAVEADFEVAGEAENGREAVEKAVNLKPDLVILDLAMPVMNGFDAARELRKVVPDTKIILFTVEEGREVERMAREAGIDTIVLKSQTPELISRARSLLDPEEGEHNSGELRNAS